METNGRGGRDMTPPNTTNFAALWGATMLHPLMAWRLWMAAWSAFHACLANPEAMKADVLPPVALHAARQEWWWSRLVDRYMVLAERLSRGLEPLTTCTADEVILFDLIQRAEARFEVGNEGVMPDEIGKWVLSNGPRGGEGFDFDHAIEMLLPDRTFLSLWHASLMEHAGADLDFLDTLEPARWFDE